MFLETLRRGLLAHLIKFRFTITGTTCLLFIFTTVLVGHEPDNLFGPEKAKALATLRQLPHNAGKPILWGYVGAYRTSPDNTYKETAFWADENIDNFLAEASDAEIAEFVSLFTIPTVISVLRQLVEGNRSVADLAKACDISEREVEKVVELLMDVKLAARTEDNLIEPHDDAISFFLNFVSMTIMHLEHLKPNNNFVPAFDRRALMEFQ